MKSVSPLIDALGWTLLHFLWQGAVVAAALWFFLLAGKSFSSSARYAATALSMLAIAAAPVVTFLRQDLPSRTVAAPKPHLVTVEVHANNPATVAPPALLETSAVKPAPPPASDTVTSRPIQVEAVKPPRLPIVSSNAELRTYFPWIVGLWAVGVILLTMRCFVAWHGVRKMRRMGTPPVDPVWTVRFEKLGRGLRISRPVSLLVSATSAVPLVIGWIKPVVLVPAGIFAGLSAAQLEAILAHELAHIRRQDYLLNLCQAAVETVLFYHPAVWWVSARMREEREHCCDDIAASLTGSALDYARALTALEEFRGLSTVPAGSISAAGGSLLCRVRRLLGMPAREPLSGMAWVFGGVAVLVAGLAFTGVKEARGGTPTTQSKETKAEVSRKGTEGKQEQAVATALDFFAAPDAEAKLKFLHPHDPWKDSAVEFFKRRSVRPLTAGRLLELPDGIPFLMEDGQRFILGFSFPEGIQFIVVKEQDDAMWVSWKDSTLRHQAAYEDALADQPETPFVLPATVQADDYYNYEFADSGRWRCFKLTCPGVSEELFGYAAVGSDVPAQVEGLTINRIKGVVDVTVKFPTGKSGRKQVEILSVEDSRPDKHADSSDPPSRSNGAQKQETVPAVSPVTDGTNTALVVQPPGQEPIVILTKREFTASAESTSDSGSITMPVNTSDKTLTITYKWNESAPGVLDLKAGLFSVSHFDVSRGRVFLVHFDTMEFAARIFQVPAEVKVTSILSPALLTEAAAQISAWYVTCDDHALWERTRVIVEDSERRKGIPLDDAAEKIVWGGPNAAGLRLGLEGLDPNAGIPLGQTVPVAQYIRNDGPETVRISPTGIFNEGVDGELIRASDGRKFPHQKGYRWQISFDRVQLAPSEYIKLQSGLMRTRMAEKDGSSTGGMEMLEQGFTAPPGDYTLNITHGIGQFLGRPVNGEFGDPRNAPGLGEWTGMLKSASVPLRLVDPQIRTAKPGEGEAFGPKFRIDFEKGVLRLRHYHGYPQMAMSGDPWEPDSRDWKTKAADGDYLVAWAVGGNGFWVKDAGGITHLTVKENLTETGHWPEGQAPGEADALPAGIREIFGLPPLAAQPPFDFKTLPASPGPAKIEGEFFEMLLPLRGSQALPETAPVLKVPRDRNEFYGESAGITYGPATGNPVIELGLTDLLRKKLEETPNTSGLKILEHMIREGRGAIRDCAFRLLGELQTPQTPFAYDALFHAMIGAQIEDEDGPKSLSAEARTGGAWFWNLFHESRREWERTRPILPDDRYAPSEAPANSTGIQWTPGSDGISMGVSGLDAGTGLEIGKALPLTVYLRNDGAASVKLSVPEEHNPVLQIHLTDSTGKTWPAIYRFGIGVTGYRHYQISSGQSVTAARLEMETYPTAADAETYDHKEGKEHNPRLAAPAGEYKLSLEYRNYQVAPPTAGPSSEWTGKITYTPLHIKLTAPSNP